MGSARNTKDEQPEFGSRKCRMRSGFLSRNEVAGAVGGQLDQRKAEERRLANCGATHKHGEAGELWGDPQAR